MPVVITRSCNNYGPHQFPEKLIPLMIWKAAEGEPPPVYGDGQQRREWVYVEDNAEATLWVLEGGQVGEVYNIGSGRPVPNLEVVQRLCDLVAERLGKPKAAVRGLITFVKERPRHGAAAGAGGARAERRAGRAWGDGREEAGTVKALVLAGG